MRSGRSGWIGMAGLAMVLALGASALAASQLAVGPMRCEYRENPLGIAATHPRLGWVLQATDPAARGVRQGAYQIFVASSRDLLGQDKADLWDSGKVASDQCNQIAYAGNNLASRAECWWKVRVWDQDGNASEYSEPAKWTMGLLQPADWQAKWIGFKPQPAAEEANLAGARWIWASEGNPAAQAPAQTIYARTTVSLPADRKIKSARLVGTCDDRFVLSINGKEVARSKDETDAWKTPLRADATGALVGGENTLAVAATNTSAGPAGLIARILVEFETGPAITLVTSGKWKISKQAAEGWDKPGFADGTWAAAKELGDIGMAPWGQLGAAGGNQMQPVPFLRRTFTVSKPVRKATAYVSAQGAYELTLNGKRIGADELAPGWSDYPKRVYYFTYDVSDLVKQGKNAVGAMLGDGWYASFLAFTGKRHFYGGDPRLIAQIEVTYQDGSRQTIGTSEFWKVSVGPWRYADMLMGVSYDASKEMPGWDLPEFDDSSWQPVTVSPNPECKLEPHPGVAIRRHEQLPALKMTEPKPGVFIYDLGQNMVGWVRVQVAGEEGQTLQLRHAEMLNPDGTMYTTNLRAARATDVFKLKSGPQVCEPKFTFHGFRYVELTGIKSAPKPEDVLGIAVYSDLPRASTFTCSDPLVNKLVENIHWGQKGNYLDIPTDCPQRDERAGWTGDAQVFMKTAAFNMDIAPFFTKWLVDLAEDGQRADGAYPDVAPSILGHGNVAWGDAAPICVWRMYELYGDTRVIQHYYPFLQKYMGFLQKNSKDNVRGVGAYGDWLLLAGPQHSDVHGTAYYYYVTTLMADMARVLGQEADAAQYRTLAESIRKTFAEKFVKADGRVVDTKGATGQTLYALALAWDLVPENLRAKAAEQLVNDLEKQKWHLQTGFIGTPLLLPVLEKVGRPDVAYRVLLNQDYPGWLYQVKLGSTTMWERWDGWKPDKGFQDPGMNSFNHYWLGCVGEWLYTGVAGVDAEAPGFAKIRIRPQVANGLTNASLAYDSIRGRIESAWKIEGDKLTLDVTIPPNTTATIYVPTADAGKVTESGKPAAEAKGLKFLRQEKSAAVYEAGSGRYQFAVPAPGR